MGRFLVVRKTYSAFRKFQERMASPQLKYLTLNETPQVFREGSLSLMLDEVKKEGVTFGISLERSIVEQIYQFALQSECMEPGFPYSFSIQDVDKNGELIGGHIPVRALVKQPLACSAIRALSHNQMLLSLARGYLGYFPGRISCHLTWSLATPLSVQNVEKRYPPASFHYDIAGYNFATAYFYLTPVLDLESGPHEMILGSHQKKALRMLFRSGRHQPETLYQYYGQDQVLAIIGDKGFGFFQDPSCFHRVRPPIHQHRLLLQFRYS